MVRRWLLSLQSRPRRLAPSSIAGRVRTLKAFGTWVAGEFDLAFEPAPGSDRSHAYRSSWFRACATQKSSPCCVPSMAPAIRSATGQSCCSCSTPAFGLAKRRQLRVGDLDLVEGRCRVFGKGGKERLVPVGRRARKAVRRSLSHRHGVRDDDPLFTGLGGRRLTARGLYQLVHRLASRAELQTRCSPHVLRHTFARSFLTNGGDVFSLQRILGHSPSSHPGHAPIRRSGGRRPPRRPPPSVASRSPWRVRTRLLRTSLVSPYRLGRRDLIFGPRALPTRPTTNSSRPALPLAPIGQQLGVLERARDLVVKLTKGQPPL